MAAKLFSSFVVFVLACLVTTASDSFEQFLKDGELHDSTVETLKKNGIISKDDLRRLKETDIIALGLSIRQQARLRDLITQIMLENMNETEFWCLFKCLGGIGAVGAAGILALVGLVAAVGSFGIVPILMAWYGGAVPAGGFVALLQGIVAAGVGYKAIMLAFFSPAAMYAALEGGCRKCFEN